MRNYKLELRWASSVEDLRVFLRGIRSAIFRRSIDLVEIDDLATELRIGAHKSRSMATKFKEGAEEKERYLQRAEMLDESASYLTEYISLYLAE